MAGIYIPSMKMPQYYGDYDATFSVMPDGKVTVAWACEFCPTLDEFCGEVIPVPDHGRLIDADALMENAQYKGSHDILTAWDVVAAPSIIPADRKERKA